MEKSRAIELLEHLAWDRDIDRNPCGDALRMAIDALKAQHSSEGITKDATSDTISRTEVVEHLRRMLEATVPNTDYDEGFIDGVEFGISTVSTMPPAQSQSTAGQLNDSAQSTARSTNLIDRQQAIEKFTMTAPQMSVIRIYEAVEILESMPTIQPVATDTNVGDTISRQAAIDALDFEIVHTTAYCDGKNEGNPLAQYNKGLEDGKKAIEALPPAQPEPHEGYWIRRDCGLDVECKCSKCGYRDFVKPRDEYWFKRNYCPNCGAKMKGERTK